VSTDWYCPECGEKNDGSRELCFACGTAHTTGEKPPLVNLLAAGVAAKVRGDDLRTPYVEQSKAAKAATAAKPLGEGEVLGLLGFIAACAGVIVLLIFKAWRNGFEDPYGTTSGAPWAATHAWPFALAVAVHVFVLGRIYVSLLRADRAHLR
jgi:hypothetical protein